MLCSAACASVQVLCLTPILPILCILSLGWVVFQIIWLLAILVTAVIIGIIGFITLIIGGVALLAVVGGASFLWIFGWIIAWPAIIIYWLINTAYLILGWLILSVFDVVFVIVSIPFLPFSILPDCLLFLSWAILIALIIIEELGLTGRAYVMFELTGLYLFWLFGGILAAVLSDIAGAFIILIVGALFAIGLFFILILLFSAVSTVLGFFLSTVIVPTMMLPSCANLCCLALTTVTIVG
jgi:hypothetical protein